MKKSFRKFLKSPPKKEITREEKLKALHGLEDRLTRQNLVHTYALSKMLGDNVTAYNSRMMYEKLPNSPDSNRMIADTKAFFESATGKNFDSLLLLETKGGGGSIMMGSSGGKIVNTTTTGYAGLGREEGEAIVGAKPLFTDAATDRNTVVGRQYIRWQGDS